MVDRVVLTINSELFDDNARQEASVRQNVTIRGLIEEIRREFSLLEGNYILLARGSEAPLPPDQTLEQLGIQTGSELTFDRERRRLSQRMVVRGGQVFQPLSATSQAILREEGTGALFEIAWQPAVIGRADANNPATGSMLAVDLSSHTEARSVSRQHARITEQGGQFFLEGIAARNPTFLNDHQMLPGERRALQHGDQIRVGKVVLVFNMQKPKTAAG